MDQKNVSQSFASDAEGLVLKVKEHYGRIAEQRESGCCGPARGCGDGGVALETGYGPEDQKAVPEGADLGLGCGAPVDFLGLQPGETVLDLGSGGGIDVFLAARRVGPGGRVIGVDMTPAMIDRARRNAEKAGFANVEFREGRLEALPVEDASIDAVTSNCVVNLVPDKSAVFREVARVLRPDGRLVISDILLDRPLPEAIRQDVLAYVGCVSGAQERNAYFDLVRAAGFAKIEVLKDVDSLGGSDLAHRGGTEVAGAVRSVTFRASKR